MKKKIAIAVTLIAVAYIAVAALCGLVIPKLMDHVGSTSPSGHGVVLAGIG